MTKLQEELTIVAGKTCEVGPKKSFFLKFKPDFIRRIFKYIISLDLFSKNLPFFFFCADVWYLLVTTVAFVSSSSDAWDVAHYFP